MLRLKFTRVTVLLAAVLWAMPLHAAEYNFHGKLVDVEHWTGTGPNEALMVLDFGGDDSYVLGYRWTSGTTVNRPGDSAYVQSHPTVDAHVTEALLLSLAADSASGFGLGYAYHNTFGFSVNSLSYAGHTIVSDWVNTYAAFWLSGHQEYTDYQWDPVEEDYVAVLNPAMSPDGETWAYSGLGASTRVLEDGFYDGWTAGDATTFVAQPPSINFVPEPGTLMLVAMIAGMSLHRRRTTR